MVDREIIKKVVLLGDPGVGKTSLIRRFVKDYFSDDYLSTIGAKVTEKDLRFQAQAGETLLHLVIWDIAGQQGLAGIKPNLFKGAQGALVVCDLSRRQTFDGLGTWILHFRQQCGAHPFCILANKWDLYDRRDFDYRESEGVAKAYNVAHYCTSAKTGENVERAFRTLGTRMLERDGIELPATPPA